MVGYSCLAPTALSYAENQTCRADRQRVAALMHLFKASRQLS